MVINPVASGIQTFLSANQRIQESASEIAKSSDNGVNTNLVEPIIELKVAEQQAVPATKIIEVEKSQIGTLLDVLG
ncbi:MAG: hypothetical protein GY808_14040 [Gammaproteobacteria bacterium]|nr:hypothetical protein [Gammaproteobacteria bacterium]